MTLKPIAVDPAIHRQLAIWAAMSGESMRSIAERAIKRELDQMAEAESQELQSATSDGSSTGA